MMKRTAIAAAVALALGGGAVGSAEANTAGLTGVWTGTYLFTMTSPGGGPVGGSGVAQNWTFNFDAGTVSISNTTAFYGSVWTAHNTTFTDNGTNYGGNGTTANMFFDWSVNTNIPVAEQWDVTSNGNTVGSTATATHTLAVILPSSPAFPGFHPAFDGTLTKVPVPAAVWLMGSGLVGLVGVGRRRRRS
jgi:hypothetical protein